jgi:hypothetical protein
MYHNIAFREIIVTVFAGTVVIGLTSTVHAQAIVSAPLENSSTTLSGESLRGLEGRNLTKDSSNLFSGTSPFSDTLPISLDDTNSAPSSQVAGFSVFGQKVKVPSGRTSRKANDSGHIGLNNIQFSAGGSSLDSEQVLNVRYQLLSPKAN